MKHLIKSHLFSSIFIITLLTLSGCKDKNNLVDGLSPAQSAQSSITPANGGKISLSNTAGDSIYLEIPSNAVTEPIVVTVQLLNGVEANPFVNNLINSIRLLPSGTKLNRPAELKIKFKSIISDTACITLYYRKGNDLAYLLRKKEVTANSITTEVFHFSDFGSAVPSKGEIINQSDKIKTSSGVDVWNWQEFVELVTSMLRYIEMLMMFGEDERADELMQKLEQRIIEQVNAFLDLPIPNDPCGNYQQALMKYAELVFMMVSDQTLSDRVSDRIGEIRNRCFIKGEVEYKHDYTYNTGEGSVHRTIKGLIPFTVNTHSEPYGKILGSGSVVWRGDYSGVPCISTENGTMQVNFDGEMEADSLGRPLLNFKMHETASGTITVVCPNGSATYPMNPPPTVSEASFLMIDGYTVTQPVAGASGNFVWILHLNIQP